MWRSKWIPNRVPLVDREESLAILEKQPEKSPEKSPEPTRAEQIENRVNLVLKLIKSGTLSSVCLTSRNVA